MHENSHYSQSINESDDEQEKLEPLLPKVENERDQGEQVRQQLLKQLRESTFNNSRVRTVQPDHPLNQFVDKLYKETNQEHNQGFMYRSKSVVGDNEQEILMQDSFFLDDSEHQGLLPEKLPSDGTSLVFDLTTKKFKSTSFTDLCNMGWDLTKKKL